MAREYKTKISQAIEAFAAERKDMGFCAADVRVYLEDKGIDANITTIYRNLDRMSAQDKLIKYQSAEGNSSMYMMEKKDHSCHDHLHMRCMVCGKVIHIEDEVMSRIADEVKARYGFVIDCDSSSISGVCRTCRSGAANDERSDRIRLKDTGVRLC